MLVADVCQATSRADLLDIFLLNIFYSTKHLLRVGNPRLYDHPNPRPQLELWPPQAVEWFVIIKATPYGLRPRHKRIRRVLVIQPPLLADEIPG
jgi:hypothetical protein